MDLSALSAFYPEPPCFIYMDDLESLVKAEGNNRYSAYEKVINRLIKEAEQKRLDKEIESGESFRIYDYFRI